MGRPRSSLTFGLPKSVVGLSVGMAVIILALKTHLKNQRNYPT